MNKDLYEITKDEFLEFKDKVLQEFKDIDKLEFKDIDKLEFKDLDNRDKTYMIIDNSGDAWIQSFKNYDKRLIIGNINNIYDWDKICNNMIKK